ncbi:hypothetical protein NPIL_267741 [Nephila pilipes]|uniref:Uncharacterized protein n=1 Tax=Nephila pilipes TaxID=299642 RepID=A0A8X6MQ37_NEPPI|nr:hypothetical protein NPIL_267741 [Nephila pilipes]
MMPDPSCTWAFQITSNSILGRLKRLNSQTLNHGKEEQDRARIAIATNVNVIGDARHERRPALSIHPIYHIVSNVGEAPISIRSDSIKDELCSSSFCLGSMLFCLRHNGCLPSCSCRPCGPSAFRTRPMHWTMVRQGSNAISPDASWKPHTSYPIPAGTQYILIRFKDLVLALDVLPETILNDSTAKWLSLGRFSEETLPPKKHTAFPPTPGAHTPVEERPASGKRPLAKKNYWKC